VASWNNIELDELTLTSSRLTLRPWLPTDSAAALEGVAGDPWMREFLPVPDPYTAADAVEFVTSLGHEGRFDGTGFGGAIIERSTGRAVGGFGLRLPVARHDHCEIGYSVWPGGRGNGYAAELSDTLARWAFAHGIGRVEIHCSVRNVASIKTALTAGFTFEGIARQQLPVRSGIDDGARFTRVRRDSGAPIPPFLVALPAAGLSDGVIRLRVTDETDADALIEENEDPVSRSWAFTNHPVDHDAVRSLAAAGGLRWLVGPLGRLTIVDLASGHSAGSVQLRFVGPPNVANLGYAVHPDFRGRGYSTRALELVAPWAFDQAGFARLELGAKAANIASQQAARRAGFESDGVRVARLRNPDGTFSDEVRFARVRPGL
jgi:RimJ/RimL family protein N-acetyltransferase